MPKTLLERELAQIWSDVLGIPDVGIHDDFFALGGDSILGAEAVARIRDLTGRDDLPLISIVRAATVAGMIGELGDTVPAAAGSGAIAIQAEGAKRALFFVHGVDGEVLRFVALARRLDSDRPVYGLRARGIDGDGRHATSVEEMAREYLKDVRTIQPRGAYLIGGFCMGASVALEMVRLLREEDEDAELLLVDPRFGRTNDVRYVLWLVPRRAREGRLVGAVFRRLTRRGVPVAAAGPETATWEVLSAAREAYRPVASDQPASVIVSNDYLRYELPEWHIRRVVRGVQSWVQIDWDHEEMFRPPAVDLLASEVQSALARLDSVR